MTMQELKALVVDDEVDMCWALERVLQGEGIKTHSAHTAEGALAILKKDTPQLAFVDIKLPDMDGIELAKVIKASNPSLPLVLISGYYYGDDPVIKKGLEEGLYVGFISKPFEVNEIRSYARRFFPKEGDTPP